MQARGPRSSRRSKKRGGGALKGCGGMFGAFAALVLMFGGGVILGHRTLSAAEGGALRALDAGAARLRGAAGLAAAAAAAGGSASAGAAADLAAIAAEKQVLRELQAAAAAQTLAEASAAVQLKAKAEAAEAAAKAAAGRGAGALAVAAAVATPKPPQKPAALPALVAQAAVAAALKAGGGAAEAVAAARAVAGGGTAAAAAAVAAVVGAAAGGAAAAGGGAAAGVVAASGLLVPQAQHPKTASVPSFALYGHDYMKASRPVDSAAAAGHGDSVTVTAWIYLSGLDRGAKIKTVVANRVSGCETNAAHYGYSLAVNSWEQSDQQLIMEWGSPSTGCEKLASGVDNKVPYDEWTHVGVSVRCPGAGAGAGAGMAAVAVADDAKARCDLSLFINGEVVAAAASKARPAQLAAPLVVGDLENGGMGFIGNISSVVVWGVARTQQEVRQQMLGGLPAVLGGGGGGGGGGRAGGAAEATDEAGDAKLLLAVFDLDEPLSEVAAVDRAIGGDAKQPPGPGPGGQGRLGKGRAGGHYKRLAPPPDLFRPSAGVAVTLGSATEVDPVVSAAERAQLDAVGRERAALVKAAMVHAWGGYKERAWGKDTLLPRSGGSENQWGAMGMTLLDSLDTLWIMGMRKVRASVLVR